MLYDQAASAKSTGKSLAKVYLLLALTLATLIPLSVIIYLLAFGGAKLSFHHFVTHEIAIIIAVTCSASIGMVAHANYRTSGEEYQYWVALAYFAFAVVYAPHGILTRLADTHLPAFLVFGPASRLYMGCYLLLAIFRFSTYKSPARRLWPHFLGFILAALALSAAAFAGGITIPQVRALEAVSNGIFILTLLVMLVRWRPVHLLGYHLAALLLFIQASAAFLLSKPWTHLWWFAHLVSASGFLILGYAIMRAYRQAGAFSLVFSSSQLHLELQKRAVELESKQQEQTALIQELNILTDNLKTEVAQREKTINDLNLAKDQIKTLNGVLPICMHCKGIRDDKGYWKQLENYIAEHSDAQLSHGICERCMDIHYPGVAEKMVSKSTE